MPLPPLLSIRFCLFPDINSLVAYFKALRVPTIATGHKLHPPLLLYTCVQTIVSSLTSDHLPISYFKALRVPTIATGHKPHPPLLRYMHSIASSLTSTPLLRTSRHCACQRSPPVISHILLLYAICTVFCLFPDINSLVAYFKALRAPPVVSHILLLSSNALYCLFPDIYSLVARFKALRVPTIATNHKPRPPLLLYTSVHTFVSSLTSDHLPISYFKALRANDRGQLEAASSSFTLYFCAHFCVFPNI